MTRAIQVYAVPNDALAVLGLHAFPSPPHPWFVRGPRGGLYLAEGNITMTTNDAVADYFTRNLVLIKFESERLRYVRPGSRLAKLAVSRDAP